MRKVCLVLSGGAAKCLAHIGVYRYFFEKGFEIVGVSGSSGGAVVGAFIAAGYLPCQMERIAEKLKPFGFLKPNVPPKESLFSWKPIGRFLSSFLPDSFSELKIPLWVSATDLLNGENVLIGEGELLDAVLASAALPPFFAPVKKGNRLLADGAFTNDLPVEPFEKRECLKVCVDVTPIFPTKNLSGMFDYAVRAFTIGIRIHKENRYSSCDAVVKPDLRGLGFVRYENPLEYVRRGFSAAKETFERGKI